MGRDVGLKHLLISMSTEKRPANKRMCYVALVDLQGKTMKRLVLKLLKEREKKKGMVMNSESCCGAFDIQMGCATLRKGRPVAV